MSPSLQRHLSIALAWVIVATGLAAAAVSFLLGYNDAQEFQDDMLRQIAALAPQADSSAARDSESRVFVYRLPAQAHPAWLDNGLPAGFHTFVEAGEGMRVFVRDLPPGGKLVVAQPTAVRDELALNNAVRTLLPVLLLLPILVWLTARVVARAMKPVRRLANDLDRQSAARLERLPDDEIPEEIASFVHAINGLLERVNGLLEGQRRFVADAAHELRTPLAALSLQAQNVESAESLGVARERMAALHGGIERARRLTEQLLSLARSQSSAGEEAGTDAWRMVRDLIEEYLPAARAKRIDLGMDAQGTALLRGTAETLRMVIGNALDNAVRHTPEGGTVTVKLRATPAETVIEVIDAGPGIPEAHRERVFDPFHRLEGAPPGGSGLGLAIARDAASRLGGEVSLHEGPGGSGLLFRFRSVQRGGDQQG